MTARARLVGINHVALEVGDVDEALELYGAMFDSACAVGLPGWPSSTWATSSWRSRRNAPSRPTTSTTSASS